MLAHVGLQVFESMDRVFLLAIDGSDDIDHQDSISTVRQARAQRQRLRCKVIDFQHLIWICPPCNAIVEKDALFKEHIHLVLVTSTHIVWLLKDVQIVHFFEGRVINLVDLYRLLSLGGIG